MTPQRGIILVRVTSMSNSSSTQWRHFILSSRKVCNIFILFLVFYLAWLLNRAVFLHFLPLMCRDGAKIQKFSEILTSEVCFFSNFAILKVELNK